MKPLSAVYYSLNNKKKLLSMVISIGFSIALIYTLQFFVYEPIESVNATSLNPLKEFSKVSPDSDSPIPEEVITNILQNQNTEKVIPLLLQQTFFYSLTGKNSVNAFLLDTEDMGYLINKLGLTLVQGRLPASNQEEAIMDAHLAKNKGLKIGDRIGNEVDEKEPYINGSYEIVGLLKGESMMVLLSRTEQLSDEELFRQGMIVFQKEGKLKETNQYLETLSKDISVITYQMVYNSRLKDMKDMRMYINILVTMLIIILSISMGNASYIHTYERRYEFALLNSVGYSQIRILLKAMLEIFLINMIGYLIGLFATLLFAGIIYLGLFEPNGLSMRLFLPQALLQTLLIPMFVTLFCIIPVSRMQKKIDPISIIEGVE